MELTPREKILARMKDDDLDQVLDTNLRGVLRWRRD